MIMKKLQKLTLKGLENSATVIRGAEDQRAIVAGSSGDQIPPGMLP